eukprot:CAMPEP_0168624602 /NCGR_PEP_ID=MMETSP0449_2-20121227/9513_1 /TAXON_ID=1082188 /ORGANISM="Strombidium rassoulzadegani, Strain ras09" /LENGTH=73 /DNA_ID=CAMNT_0008666195 /DNA_START=812 /DNA_END=1030 /DNA_ORIENTATION=-
MPWAAPDGERLLERGSRGVLDSAGGLVLLVGTVLVVETGDLLLEVAGSDVVRVVRYLGQPAVLPNVGGGPLGV